VRLVDTHPRPVCVTWLDRLTISVALLHPQSRGRVLLRSRNPFDTPIVQPNYLERYVGAWPGGLSPCHLCSLAFSCSWLVASLCREEDVETLVEGLALARTLVSHAAFAQFQYVHCEVRERSDLLQC
jgi:choline dehydrogenase-like flavoprotein